MSESMFDMDTENCKAEKKSCKNLNEDPPTLSLTMETFFPREVWRYQ